MKPSAFLLSSLLCAAPASAQYFSAGWAPGQAVSSDPPAPEPTFAFDPAASVAPATPLPSPGAGEIDPSKLGIVDKLMLSAPVSALFGKLGINTTEAIARGAVSPWDERVPLITDENFEEMVVNEPLTEQEEKDRVWFIVVSVTAANNNAISKIVDKAFDDAYNMTVVANDLPNVRFGRIDYMSVTYITTKWNLWTGPWLVIATERGQKLRFYKASGIRLTPELIRELLTEELWRESQPWQSAFGPGGKREFVLHYIALGMKKVFDTLNRVPRFVLMLASGTVASMVIRLLHKSPEEPAKRPATTSNLTPAKSETETVVSASSAASNSTATSSPSKKAKQRKAGKK